jgi:hypothetical protein
MANNLKYAVTLKNARLDQIASAIGNGGKLQIYDGTQPTNPDTAIGSQVKLAELTCGSPFAGAASGGVLTANAITAANAIATGTASWFRITTSGGSTGKVDGTVGTSGCDLIIDNTSINSGQQVSVTSLTITHAN